jgi:methionine sulfoxide reductase heme-binding subunit
MPPATTPPRATGIAGKPMPSPVNRWLMHPFAKPLVFLAASLPFAWLVWAAFADQLGANPAEALIRSLGDWNIRFLVLVLLVTPLRTIAGWPALARLRRMLGLFVFFYSSMHLLAYAWFDQGFVWSEVVTDIAKRPFILVGMLAWSMLLMLTLTSFNKAIRWLGARRWQWLHRLVYAIAGLAVLHFFWMRSGKNDFAEVAVYASAFTVLLGWRAWRSWVRCHPSGTAAH